MPRQPKAYHHGDLKNALIQAGISILSKEGVSGLSLRKVAQKAGVSHAAPYAHFSDKQALIAAISTEGHKKVNAKMAAILAAYPADPTRQFVETAWAYLQFGLDEPEHFRITFSGVVEQERDYPALVAMTRTNWDMIRGLVSRCQEAGLLNPGQTELIAMAVWGLVHGLVSLIQQGQVSHVILDRYSLRELLIATLNQVSRIKLDPRNFPE